MEENNNLSAEQSLKLINDTINSSCRAITKKCGMHLLLWGVLLILVSLLIFFLWRQSGSARWNLLWSAMPVIGYPLAFCLERKGERIPDTFVSSRVWWIWTVFGGFSIGLFLSYILIAPMNISLAIIVLLGFALSATGILLKSWSIIFCGFITGMAGAFNAVFMAHDCHQMLIFTVAGIILALTGLYISFIRK